MKRILLLLLALFAATASATDLRMPRNRSSGGKICTQVNVAGVLTDGLCVDASSTTEARVGIGSTAPATLLDVNGIATLGPSAGAVVHNMRGALSFGVGSSTGTPTYGLRRNGSNALEFFTNSVSIGLSDSSGNWTLGASGGTGTHTVNGVINYGDQAGNYRAATRAGTIASIASAGTSDITLPSSNFHGTFDVACNNTGNGNLATAKYLRVTALGSAVASVQTISADVTGSGGACAFTVTGPGNSTLRLTNSGACTTAVAMTCHWWLIGAQSD